MFDSPILNSKKVSVSGGRDEKLRENDEEISKKPDDAVKCLLIDMTPNVGTPKLGTSIVGTPKLSTPKIGTPLNVSFKNTPNSLQKVKSGAGICNEGTPVDVPKLRPGNEPPIPPNKNEVVLVNNAPDEEEVQTIKKHLFDSPMGNNYILISRFFDIFFATF